jgi:ABC-type multidrug transport system fused ATPase/permease subunit
LKAEYVWYVKQNPSSLINSINWRNQIQAFYVSLLRLLTDFFLVIVVLTGLSLIQPVVTILVFGVLGTAAGIIYIQIKKRVDWESSKVRDLKVESFVQASKAIHGIKDVKIFLKEQYFSKLFSAYVYRLVKLLGRQHVLTVAPAWFLETTGFLIIVGVSSILLYLFNSTTTAVFSTVALIAIAAWKILPALNRISASLTRIRVAIPYIDTILDYLDSSQRERLQSINEVKQQSNSHVLGRRIDLNSVSFSYLDDEEYALRNVSFSIGKGETIGVVGHSGAGKSTLVDILIGLLKPNEGAISIDGRRMDEDFVANWRAAIGYVPQFPYIHYGSLAENIAFGERRERIDRIRVLKVCQMASIDFLDLLQDGIDTIIGERGIRLSGGQRQRVAIARALYREPEVLIFDEATSSLDSKSEAEILRTIYGFKARKTLIIVAHRLTTVEHCDRLMWLEKGLVIAVGSARYILNKYRQEYLKLSEQRIPTDGHIDATQT